MNNVNRREFLKFIGVTAASLAVPGCLPSQRRTAYKMPVEKPNIVIILADDLGYGDSSCYGSKINKTPNIDALAKGGLKFTDFHTNAPMCSPTRASIVTGLYPQRCGIENALSWDHIYGLEPEKITFAEVLKKVGYRTAIFGKWHLGSGPQFNPIHQGFDEFKGYLTGCGDYQSHIDRLGKPDWYEQDKLKNEEGYATDLITDYSVDFIKRNKNNPFCLFVSHEAVHFPYQGPNDKADRYLGGDFRGDIKYGSRKDQKAAYKEMIESMDAGIGKVVKTIKDLDLERKTFVFFMSDNGGHHLVASNAPYSGFKFDLWEGGHRVPAIAYWPGMIKPNTVTNEMTMTFDLFPTIVQIAGAKLEKGHKIDGATMLPLMLEGKKMPERTFFWYRRSREAIRKGPWKLLVNQERDDFFKVYQLYNLDEDPAEMNDLAEKYPQKVKKMKAEYDAWMKKVSKGVKWQRR